jgi:Ring finger domain
MDLVGDSKKFVCTSVQTLKEYLVHDGFVRDTILLTPFVALVIIHASGADQSLDSSVMDNTNSYLDIDRCLGFLRTYLFRIKQDKIHSLSTDSRDSNLPCHHHVISYTLHSSEEILQEKCDTVKLLLLTIAMLHLVYDFISNFKSLFRRIRSYYMRLPKRDRVTRTVTYIPPLQHNFTATYRDENNANDRSNRRLSYEGHLSAVTVSSIISQTEAPIPYHDLLPSIIHKSVQNQQATSILDLSCPICLECFIEKDIVITCQDGCKNWFHADCLHEWLDRSSNCPYCRKELQ